MHPIQGIKETLAALEASTGRSAAQAFAAKAEAVYAGDFAAACRRIAQLEMVVLELEEKNADLERRLGLAESMAETFTSKAENIDRIEQIVALNRQYGTDPATEAFVAGQVQRKRKDGTNGGKAKGRANQALKNWVFSEYLKSAGTGPYEAGAKLALRFEKPFGNPELNLADFGSRLSRDNLARKFGDWIKVEFFPVSS